MRLKVFVEKATPPLFSTLLLLPSCMVLFSSCTHSQNSINATGQIPVPALKEFELSSPAFKTGEAIPMVYTCDSTNGSPALEWSKPPGNVNSYVLIMDDPDAPMGTWVHWVVFDIPSTCTRLPAKFPTDSVLNNGIKQGITSFGLFGYRGPCPPDGVHHYHFKLFALDTVFSLACASTGEKKLTVLMKGHIVAEAALVGIYQMEKAAKQ